MRNPIIFDLKKGRAFSINFILKHYTYDPSKKTCSAMKPASGNTTVGMLLLSSVAYGFPSWFLAKRCIPWNNERSMWANSWIILTVIKKRSIWWDLSDRRWAASIARASAIRPCMTMEKWSIYLPTVPATDGRCFNAEIRGSGNELLMKKLIHLITAASLRVWSVHRVAAGSAGWSKSLDALFSAENWHKVLACYWIPKKCLAYMVEEWLLVDEPIYKVIATKWLGARCELRRQRKMIMDRDGHEVSIWVTGSVRPSVLLAWHKL